MKKHRIKSELNNEFMNPLELGRYLGFKRRTIYARLASGELPGAKLFGSWRFRKSDIDKWIETHSNQLKKRRQSGKEKENPRSRR